MVALCCEPPKYEVNPEEAGQDDFEEEFITTTWKISSAYLVWDSLFSFVLLGLPLGGYPQDSPPASHWRSPRVCSGFSIALSVDTGLVPLFTHTLYETIPNELSLVNEDGVMNVKQEACDRLLSFRVDAKLRTKKVNDFLNRLHVAVQKPRDDKQRLPFIPEAVILKKQAMLTGGVRPKKRLERDIELEMGDDYILDLKKHYDLPDKIKHHKLEREEELREEAGYYDDTDEEDENIKQLASQIVMVIRNRSYPRIVKTRIGSDFHTDRIEDPRIRQSDPILTDEILGSHRILGSSDVNSFHIWIGSHRISSRTGSRSDPKASKSDPILKRANPIRSDPSQIREKKKIMKIERHLKKCSNKPTLPRNTAGRKRERSVSGLKRKMSELGVEIDTDNPITNFARSVSRSRSKGPAEKRMRLESTARSRSRSMSKAPRNEMGIKDATMKTKLGKMHAKAQKKGIAKHSRKGEGDRRIFDLKPKHLFVGKRGVEKTDRR
ncbi:Nucleolar GTP-binding protein 1 [Folsomia candida]|uniref:Nucleolar GTP-binding protein 1 n=1 Tax=Folsomia candida TaxID=158441 RepID=A0A226EH52_FOLCA|nr:Nucleolar GTP-binding protein 1 [Folsomia candida]